MDTELQQRIKATIPEHVRPGLEAYIEHGQPPGGFLRAVLENKLYEAFSRADPTNEAMMGAYTRVLTFMPDGSWGTSDNVRRWIERKGLSHEQP